MHARGISLAGVLLAGSLAAATQVPAVAAPEGGFSSTELVRLSDGTDGWTVVLDRLDECDAVTPVADTSTGWALLCGGEHLEDGGGLTGGSELAPGTSLAVALEPDHPRPPDDAEDTGDGADDEFGGSEHVWADPLLQLYPEQQPRSTQQLRLPRLAGYTLRWVCFATPVEQPSEEQPQQEQPGLVPAVALDWAELVDPDDRTRVRIRAMLDRCRLLRGSALA
ncbi:hypothetical protein [Angustibacter aerolatus]